MFGIRLVRVFCSVWAILKSVSALFTLLPYSHAYNTHFFCSDCGVQNLVRILYKNTKFQTFFRKICRSRKPMTITKMIDNELQTAYKCQSM